LFKSNENTYAKGRALMKLYRVVRKREVYVLFKLTSTFTAGGRGWFTMDKQ